MSAQITESTDAEVLAENAVQAFIETVSGAVVPTRELARAMISNGAAAMVHLDGREAVAKLLRDFADYIETPEPHGNA